jgi:hypothetical protein
MGIVFFSDPLSIVAKSDERWLVYRRETPERCFLDAEQHRTLEDWCKRYADPERAAASRYAGTLVKRNLGRGNFLWMPYEVERKFMADRLITLLKTRMFCACRKLPRKSLPVSPASMARDFLGCSVSELVEQFEGQFEEGMSWENFGTRGWVTDHIIPLCAFDLRRKSHIARACHHTNLRPCWEIENIRKGGKIPQGVTI